jgi:hypothetical protein
MASVLSGDSHIGFCGPEAALYVLIGGSTDVPTVFGQLTKRDGSFLVSRTPQPNFKWEDLKGKYIRIKDNGWGSTIDEIGNLMENKWFNLREFFSNKEGV